jgi:hypothetical protein
MKPLRSLIGILLIAGTLLPAQQLKLRQTRAFAIEEMEPPPLLANERFEPQQADQSGTTAKSGAATAPATRASKGKSSKKKWIIIGAVAGAVVITSLLVYKRLDNENFFN